MKPSEPLVVFFCGKNRSGRGFFTSLEAPGIAQVSLSWAHTPCFFQSKIVPHTSFDGGKSLGSIRHAQPLRTR